MERIPDPPPPKPGRGRPRKTPSFVPDPVQRSLADLARAVLPDAPAAPAAPRPLLSTSQRLRARQLLAEYDRRQCEALRIFEPLDSQRAFIMSRARQRIARGSNRSGKTTVSMVELAYAVTGTHPEPGKFPERDGRAIVVAKDLEKIGEVIWRKLGRAGSFRIVKDPDTGRWRVHRPILDDPRGLKPRPAPPLLPRRFIRDISWESKKAGIPSKVILKNGWEINFYSSKSDPYTIQGTDVDIAVFDEEIVHAGWLPEALARLIDRVGYFWWGATPQTGTQQLYELHLRAEAVEEERALHPERAAETPLVTEHFMSIWDNPYLDEKAKRDFVESIDDEERRVRVDGEFAVTGLLIYEPYFFPKGVHAVEPFAVPAAWSRYCAIDPGAQVCAVLFAAVPPPRPDDSGLSAGLFGDFVYIYQELYLKHCDATTFGRRMKEAIGDQDILAFLIDHRGGKLTEIGSGKTPEQQYRESLRKFKVPHFAKGGQFVYGSDDLDGGILRVREFLRVREDGTARLRVLEGRCPHFVHEMLRYRWKRNTDGTPQDKPHLRDNHLVDDVRYLVMYPGLKYRKPRGPASAPKGAYEAFKALRDRQLKRGAAKRPKGVTLG